jgi:hypothetical protein
MGMPSFSGGEPEGMPSFSRVMCLPSSGHIPGHPSFGFSPKTGHGVGYRLNLGREEKFKSLGECRAQRKCKNHGMEEQRRCKEMEDPELVREA